MLLQHVTSVTALMVQVNSRVITEVSVVNGGGRQGAVYQQLRGNSTDDIEVVVVVERVRGQRENEKEVQRMCEG